MTPQQTASWFPTLRTDDWSATSPPDVRYNCVAWAAGRNDAVWWPAPLGGYFWPPTVPRCETVDAFVAAFSTLGYEPCTSGELEPGIEKVAIFADAAGIPKHMARQIPNGSWTSKLGIRFEDVAHASASSLSGPAYGKVHCYLKRIVASTS